VEDSHLHVEAIRVGQSLQEPCAVQLVWDRDPLYRLVTLSPRLSLLPFHLSLLGWGTNGVLMPCTRIM
jgi:hypothetical protein